MIGWVGQPQESSRGGRSKACERQAGSRCCVDRAECVSRLRPLPLPDKELNGSARPRECGHLTSPDMEELQKDLEEVKELLKKASRKRVHDVLLAEKNKIEKEIKNQPPPKLKTETSEEERPPPTGYTVKINNYAWDQSDKFVKIYITLSGVQHLPSENVQVHFTERSFDLLVKNLNSKNYSMTFNNLLKPISVESSSRKIKNDMVLILCRKKQEGKWECLTQVEKETKEKEKASYDTSDPSEGLMNLLKKMYAEGDDEMKRSINKAWVESREKQAREDLPIDM
ncbi:calcyclin-binding protein [Hemicordylus capensis]|uniref:calcyclin-binding protein n=1 Tax=Hemicordylus capensis TaxID=884348 RepID=UPI0023024E62|nr:calcyclin-binding protein [Hemicordylus capensis]